MHLFDGQNISTYFQKLVFKCFLCTCAANDASRKVTGGPLQGLAAKWLVNYMQEWRTGGSGVHLESREAQMLA